MEINDSHALAIVNRGRTYRQLGRYEEALEDLNKAIEIDSEYAFAIASRGETYRQLGRYEEALEDLNKAIEIDDEYDWVYYDIALTYLSLDQSVHFETSLSKAIKIAQKPCQKSSARRQRSFNLALYCLVSGDLDKSKEVYQNSVENAVHQEDIQEAIRDLDDLIKEFPNFPYARDTHDWLYSLLSNERD
ncbi:tetratricopeptide repeat protein [cf. Phormidesmis sp. LEGE 11477]|uniref:tetratricopeptide repeat protein n=1 Tax=cf. Phormidesmis sp. LEGE 11477 TaxID=1828680 RepID=UPI00351D888B